MGDMITPSTPATDEQAIVMLLYSALHHPSLAIDAAALIARSPHWIGGREIAIVPAGTLCALFDLREDESGAVRDMAIDIVTDQGRLR